MVEGARLESVCTFTRTEGSNPSLSAKYKAPHQRGFLFAAREGENPRQVRQIGRKADLDAHSAPGGEGQGRPESQIGRKADLDARSLPRRGGAQGSAPSIPSLSAKYKTPRQRGFFVFFFHTPQRILIYNPAPHRATLVGASGDDAL